jgi:hypothetical protein
VDRGRLLAVEAAGHEQRPVAIAVEQRGQLLVRDPGEDGRVGDLVAVQVQDRQHCAVNSRIEELVRVPARRKWPRFRLAVADDAGDEQVGIVEGGSESMGEGVAQLAALVDRARCLRRGVARDPARERELAEELAEPFLVGAHVRIPLGVRPLQVGVRDDSRSAMARPRNVEGIEVAGADRTVQVDVDEVQARCRPEMAQQAGLDVLGREWFPQERVVQEVDLADGQVVRRTPVGVNPPELLALERSGGVGSLTSGRHEP